jgi:hypothetical protein
MELLSLFSGGFIHAFFHDFLVVIDPLLESIADLIELGRLLRTVFFNGFSPNFLETCIFLGLSFVGALEGQIVLDWNRAKTTVVCPLGRPIRGIIDETLVNLLHLGQS